MKIYDIRKLVESWICGNRSCVRRKFRLMRYESKGIFFQEAKELMSPEDFDDLLRGVFL